MKAFALLLGIMLVGFVLFVISVARMPATSLAATPSTNDAALREVKQATETCRLLLGWKEGTIIREHDFAAFALCMHPTLTKHNLLTPN